jgi:hypothetical protein
MSPLRTWLELFSVQEFECAPRDSDSRVLGRIPGCKRIDALFVFEDIDFRNRYA